MIAIQKTYLSNRRRNVVVFFVFLLLIPVFFLLDVASGMVEVPLSEVIKIILGGKSDNQAFQIIIADSRFPQALVALTSGIGLSVCGLMLQTFFRNPLVGPSILGISSGSSLGVAIVILGGTYFGFELAGSSASGLVILASIVGSFSVLFLLLLFSKFSNSNTTLLIAGIMISYLIGALVQLLEQLADKTELQQFVFWGFGSFSGHSLHDSYYYFLLVFLSVLPLLFLVKSFNVWTIGSSYASSLGINPKKFRLQLIVLSGLIAGIVTAYCGPIAFIGLAVPHIVKRLIRTNDHLVLFPAVALAGALLCILCDIVSKLPIWNSPLPLNAVTCLFGAPIVIAILLRQRNRKGSEL